MKTAFICPNCKAQVSADDSYIGRNVRCPKCSARFLLTTGNMAQPNQTSSTGRDVPSPSTATSTNISSGNEVDDLIGSVKEELLQEELSRKPVSPIPVPLTTPQETGGELYSLKGSASANATKSGFSPNVNPFIPISRAEAAQLFGEGALYPITTRTGQKKTAVPTQPSNENVNHSSLWSRFFIGDERTTYGLRNKLIVSTFMSNVCFFVILILWVMLSERGEPLDTENTSAGLKLCMIPWLIWKGINLHYLAVLSQAEYGYVSIFRILSPRRVFIMLMSAGSAPNPYYKGHQQDGLTISSKKAKNTRPFYKSPLIITVTVIGVVLIVFMYSLFILSSINRNKTAKKSPETSPKTEVDATQVTDRDVSQKPYTPNKIKPRQRMTQFANNAPPVPQNQLPDGLAQNDKNSQDRISQSSMNEQQRPNNSEMFMKADLFLSMSPFKVLTPIGPQFDLKKVPDGKFKDLLLQYNTDNNESVSINEFANLLTEQGEEKVRPLLDEAIHLFVQTKTKASPKVPLQQPGAGIFKMSIGITVNSVPLNVTSTDSRGIAFEEMKKAGFPQENIDEYLAFDSDKDGFLSIKENSQKIKADIEKHRAQLKSRSPQSNH